MPPDSTVALWILATAPVFSVTDSFGTVQYADFQTIPVDFRFTAFSTVGLSPTVALGQINYNITKDTQVFLNGQVGYNATQGQGSGPNYAVGAGVTWTIPGS